MGLQGSGFGSGGFKGFNFTGFRAPGFHGFVGVLRKTVLVWLSFFV